MVSFWEALGIGPTTDRRSIQKAYASRLKRVHPEDDPEAFQVLRSAYERALAWAGDEQRGPLASGRPAPRAFSIRTAAQKQEERERVFRAVDELMDRAKVLEGRKAPDDAWRWLLQSELLCDLGIKSAFQEALFEYLGSSRRELERGVWYCLEQNFHWKENARGFYRSLDSATVDWVLERLHQDRRARPSPPLTVTPARPVPTRQNDRPKAPREVLTLPPDSFLEPMELFFLLVLATPFLLALIDLLIEFFQ